MSGIADRLHRILAAALLLAAAGLPVAVPAAGESGVMMENIEIKLHDQRAMQRGAGLFVNYCLSCHSAKYMRYGRMAQDLQLPEEMVEENMIFSGARINDAMLTTISAEDGKDWFGVAPPDLSLVARLRGPKWLYNYLRSFYVKEDSASGWSNIVFENVAMPNVLYELQGVRHAVFETEIDEYGNSNRVFTRFEEIRPGSMSGEEFDQAVADLTHFLVYMGEPSKQTRIRYGIWVMLFMAVFGLLAWRLKKEYWRDVHA